MGGKDLEGLRRLLVKLPSPKIAAMWFFTPTGNIQALKPSQPISNPCLFSPWLNRPLQISHPSPFPTSIGFRFRRHGLDLSLQGRQVQSRPVPRRPQRLVRARVEEMFAAGRWAASGNRSWNENSKGKMVISWWFIGDFTSKHIHLIGFKQQKWWFNGEFTKQNGDSLEYQQEHFNGN